MKTVLAVGVVVFLLALAPRALAQSCIVSPPGLVGWWTGDCDAFDRASGNDGTFVNGATLGGGFNEQGLALDGVNDYVNVGDRGALDFGSLTDFTIDVWESTNGASNIQGIVDKRQTGTNLGYLVSLTSGGRVVAFAGDNVHTTQITSSISGLNDGAFHHIAVVFDRDADMTIYVDGMPDVSVSMSSVGSVSNAGSFIIGRGNVNIPTSTHRAFDGILDEIRVSNRALTASEISDIYSAGSAGICKISDIGPPIADPGFDVEQFVLVPDVCRGLFHLSFDTSGNVYVGGTKAGDNEAALPILRVSADASTIQPYGPAIPDPDGVVVDRSGSVATSGPNTPIVGSAGNIIQVDPATLVASTLFTVPGGNVQQMVFDGSGRLLFADGSASGRLGAIHSGALSIVNTFAGGIGGVAIDEANDQIFVSVTAQGSVKRLDGSGVVVDGDFVTGLSQPDALAFDAHGMFGGSLFAADRVAGTVLRIDPVTGSSDVFIANLQSPNGLAFDLEGRLCVVDNHRIWRISPETGFVSGHVLASCPTDSTGLSGVTVDAFALGTGDLVGHAVTDETGSFEIADLAVNDYVVTLVTPLGYTVASSEAFIDIGPGASVGVDYLLTCLETTSEPRGIGYWKHQVGVATGGNGHGHIDAPTLCGYLDSIAAHFHDNAANEVAVYVPPASGECNDKLTVAKELLNLRGSAGMTARARQHLMALLLNVAAGNVHVADLASEDGATVSQAITFCDALVDDPAGDHELARSIAETVNGGGVLDAGVIPLTTSDIAYRQHAAAPVVYMLNQNSPNPFAPSTSIRISLPIASRYVLTVFDVAGRAVKRFEDMGGPGEAIVRWSGADDQGKHVGPGVYFYEVQIGAFRDTKKMILTK